MKLFTSICECTQREAACKIESYAEDDKHLGVLGFRANVYPYFLRASQTRIFFKGRISLWVFIEGKNDLETNGPTRGRKNGLPISVNSTTPCKYTAVIIRARLYDLLLLEEKDRSRPSRGSWTNTVVPQITGNKTRGASSQEVMYENPPSWRSLRRLLRRLAVLV